MKTILILTPVYKRPEIVKIFLDGFKRLKKHYDKLILLCIVSPEDKHRDELIEMIFAAGGDVCEYSNKHLGEKKNKGLEFALDWHEWDYMMELGSDNLLNPEIFDLYKPYMDKKTPFFGLNNLYITEWGTKNTIFIQKYNVLHTFGAGRMLLNEAITIHPWTDELSEGLDTNAMKRLRDRGIKETVIDVGEHPYVLDIKTETNINDWVYVEPLKLKDVEFAEISKYFGIPVYPEAVMTLKSFDGFNQYLNNMKEDYNYTYKKAYEETEKVHVMHFEQRMCPSYDAYRKRKSRKK